MAHACNLCTAAEHVSLFNACSMQEPNFHVLYLELMEQMNKPMMDKQLASTTFKYIKILLRSDRIKTQVSCMSDLIMLTL